MAIAERVKADDAFLDFVSHEGKLIAGVCQAGRKFRLYEVNEVYSQVSGGVTTKGKMIRRFDPDARELEGKPAQFNTVSECVDYAKRWLI